MQQKLSLYERQMEKTRKDRIRNIQTTVKQEFGGNKKAVKLEVKNTEKKYIHI